MRLFLTGSTGFVGRNYLLAALKSNRYHEIILPIRSREKLAHQLQGDGFDKIPPGITPIITGGPDWNLGNLGAIDHVIHSAGVIFARTEKEYFRTNVEATINLFRAIGMPKKAVVISSLSAAGPCDNGEVEKKESLLVSPTCTDKPVTWYGQSKLEMEKRLLTDFPDLNHIVLRPPIILGARDASSLPLFRMVRRPLYFKSGLREKYYSIISVADLTSAITLALDKDDWGLLRGKMFYVTGPSPVTDRELILTTAKVSKSIGIIVPIPQAVLKMASQVIDSIPTWRATIPSLSVDRAKEIWPDRWVASSRLFQDTFGWKAQEDLTTMLQNTLDWYLKTGQIPRPSRFGWKIPWPWMWMDKLLGPVRK